MLDVAVALQTILDHCSVLTPEPFALSSQSLGQVLAQAVSSDIDSPPYTKAMMDGYAVRVADCSATPTTLTVIEEVAAGALPKAVLQAGQATRVMTGAPVPAGADAVVPVEKTSLDGDRVTIHVVPKVQEHILAQGREMRTDEVVLHSGAILGAQEYGLLATVGRTTVQAYPMPRVGVIATGDEVVEPARKPRPGQIRNSNGPMLMAATAMAGGLPQYLGLASDRRAHLVSLVKEGLEIADVVLLSGGVSAGKFDFVPDVLTELGVQIHFHKVLMKPGKPLLFGTNHDTLVFGLPGNPVSAFVCFHLFVRPALRKLRGEANPGPVFVPLPLAGPLVTDNNRPTYGPAKIEITAQGFQVRPMAWFGSADLRGLCGCDALVRVPAGSVNLGVGDLMPTLLLKL